MAGLSVALGPQGLPFEEVEWEGRTWTLGEELGQGKFAVVYEVTCRDAPRVHTRIAAKVIDTERIGRWAHAQLQTEVEVWKTLSHPHICKLYGSVTHGRHLILFLEHAAGGELFARIVERASFLEKEASRLMRQLLSAIAYLHERGVIHRDLKPENLLLDSMDERASLRIADFGACKRLPLAPDGSSTLAFASTPCGSLGYAAPEQLRQQVYERACDLWSAGVIAYVLLSGPRALRAAQASER
jgi:serine/threonine protein kinase